MGSGIRSAWTEDNNSATKNNREKDLEGVVEAMKRVVDKLKGENDRLRKGGGTDERKVSDAEKRAVVEKKRAEKLEEDIKVIQSKLRSQEDNAQKMTLKSQTSAQQVTGLRKELTARGDEIKLLKDQAQALVAEREELKKKIATSDARIAQLEISASRAASARPASDRDRDTTADPELRKKVSEQASEIQDLKEQLAEARRSARSGDQGVGGGKRGVATGLSSEEQKELNKLREENENLRKELAAFDLDFFEEIENLKYAHAEAVKNLKVYEGQAGKR
jgi:chromosome segregation ATPase